MVVSLQFDLERGLTGHYKAPGFSPLYSEDNPFFSGGDLSSEMTSRDPMAGGESDS